MGVRQPPAHVSIARFDWWQVRGADLPLTALKRLGLRRSLLPWGEINARFRPPLHFEAMAQLARGLIELGLAFSAGREWSPSEVVQDLRDRGLLDGPFTEIAWTGPEWVLRTL
jgi:hypothetical protein